jgi:hypothetical protein
MKESNEIDKSNNNKGIKPVNHHLISKEPEFNNGMLLLASVFPPLGILIAFGGKPTIISLCFGSIVAYIFDLLGSMEGTIMSILVLFLLIWSTLIWAGRALLQETLLNFSIVVVFGILLFFTFMIIASNFRSLRNEFDSTFYFMETIMFIIIPIISSAILSWFLCVEIPSFDLPICYSTIYFIYMLILAKPRLSSNSNMIINNNSNTMLIIPLPIIKIMYGIPILISPVLHVSIHKVVLRKYPLLDFIVSILVPAVFMLVCAEKHIGYWHHDVKISYSSYFGKMKLIISMCLFLCLQEYRVFDDIKAFSTLSEVFASTVLCCGAVSLVLAIYLHRSRSKEEENILDIGYFSKRAILNKIITLCICFASFCGGLMLNMTYFSLIACVFWALSTSEMYNFNWLPVPNMLKSIVGVYFFTCTGLTAGFVAFSFTLKTLFFLDYPFNWHYVISMEQYCRLFAFSIAITAVIPSLAINNKTIESLLPGK